MEQSAAAQARRQDVYNLDELNDAMANQPKGPTQQNAAQEEEKQEDYGDHFDYKAGARGSVVNQS